jgi:hypothetical protein
MSQSIPIAAPPPDPRKPASQKKIEDIQFRAMHDADYRATLKADPAAALRAEGTEVPAGVTITVLEYDPKQMYVILPPMMSQEFTVDAKLQRLVPSSPAQKGGA